MICEIFCWKIGDNSFLTVNCAKFVEKTSPGDDGAGLLLKLSVEGSLVKSTFCEGRRLNLKSNTAVNVSS